MANPIKENSITADKNNKPLLSTRQALVADMATTAATQTTPWGFASQAQADSIATRINLILDVLESHGLMNDA
jgi:hypothetical protein